MSYKNSKYKIKIIYNDGVEIENSIEKVNTDNDRKDNKAKLFKISQVVHHKKTTYSTEWENFESLSVERFYGTTATSYKQWNIELPSMPLKWLAFVNVHILYKTTEEILPLDMNKIRKTWFFKVNDIDDEEIVQNPELIVGINYEEAIAPQVQVKALVSIFNQEKLL